MAVNPAGIAQEGNVEVAPNSTGPMIRNMVIRAMQPDGSIQSVNMQVVSIADETGQFLDFGELAGLLRDILATQKAMLREMRGGL